MTQPVQFKQSILIAVMTGAQAVLPAIVAVAALYATLFAFRSQFDPMSSGIAVVAVVCLVLVQPPREVTAQLTSPRISAVVDVIFRWFLILGLLLGIAYVTKSPLQVYCDLSLKAYDEVLPAAGSTHSAVRIAPSRMAELTEAEWVDVCQDQR